MRVRSAARSPAGRHGQSVSSKARRAAAMARAMSTSSATSTSVTTVASDGLTTWLQVPEVAATHSPSMNRLGTAVSIEPGRAAVKAVARHPISEAFD